LFDCPGQTELYAHTSVYHTFIEYLTRDDWTVGDDEKYGFYIDCSV